MLSVGGEGQSGRPVTSNKSRQNARHHNRELRLPNLWWRALPMEALRQMPRFVALPPPSQVVCDSSVPSSIR
jgi:hypothetical protein